MGGGGGGCRDDCRDRSTSSTGPIMVSYGYVVIFFKSNLESYAPKKH